jgi:2-polyprenyl-3-methyl-5-hydroxy-6-metoxy-1,4-benzoquinol methylase
VASCSLTLDALKLLKAIETPISREAFVARFSDGKAERASELGLVWDQLRETGLLKEVNSTGQPADFAQVFAGWRSQRGMLFDGARVKAFDAAIRSVVKPGDRVIDVGAGSGILSFIAAGAGASKVYALEATPIIEDARRIAEANGLANKIDFVPGDGALFKADAPADLVLGEWAGMYLLEEWQHFNAFARSRDANLKPGGKVLPRYARLYLAPIDDSRLYVERGPGFWERPVWGFDFSLVHREQLDRTRRIIVQGAKQTLLARAEVLSIDCATADAKAFFFEHEFEVAFPNHATCHGFLGYFELDLAPGCVLDTSPLSLDTHWHQSYFPMEQIGLQKGDRLHVRVTSTPDSATQTAVLTIAAEVFQGKVSVQRQERRYTLEDTRG